MNTSIQRHCSFALMACCLSAALSACGKKDTVATVTQVVAKVGEEEISIHQVNQALPQIDIASMSVQDLQNIKREVLEKLIDKTLTVEQAIQAKLHRSPDVVAKIEAARKEVLVRAFVEQLGNETPKPTRDELKKYHDENPQLFAQRRIFTLEELVVTKQPGIEDHLRSLASLPAPIDEATTWLKAQNIKFNSGGATRAAEQIPLELLRKLHELKDGQATVFASPQAVTLLRVVSSQSVPIPEADALPRIEQYLSNRRIAEALTARLKTLRGNTSITYAAEFAPTGDVAAPVADLPKTMPTQAPTAATPETRPTTMIERGVAGLK
jgi:EpsD family peptidyl-prolyl cis-trans isomerase